jgi:hypothetical protein
MLFLFTTDKILGVLTLLEVLFVCSVQCGRAGFFCYVLYMEVLFVCSVQCGRAVFFCYVLYMEVLFVCSVQCGRVDLSGGFICLFRTMW